MKRHDRPPDPHAGYPHRRIPRAHRKRILALRLARQNALQGMAMATTNCSKTSIAGTVESYIEAFDENDLDRVMTHFAEDAVYRPGNGAERVGRAAIRQEFEPQFAGAYGAMRFDEQDRIIDEQSRKVATRWICRHDLAHGKSAGLSLKIERLLIRKLLGERFGWEGVDIIHFDEAGKIKALFTYASYARRPRLSKGLGVVLPPMKQRVTTSRLPASRGR
jgi:ketosteroid isomerase-like protein